MKADTRDRAQARAHARNVLVYLTNEKRKYIAVVNKTKMDESIVCVCGCVFCCMPTGVYVLAAVRQTQAPHKNQ